MRVLLAIALLLSLSSCSAMNMWTSAALSRESENYVGLEKNLEHIHDAELKAWLDGAKDIRLGSLSRVGDPKVIEAILQLTKVPGVGVVNVSSGSINLIVPQGVK